MLAAASTLSIAVTGQAIGAQAVTYSGVSGVLSTPDALIAPSGDFVYQYNNFMESRFENQFERGNNHVFTLGMYPRLEVGGRLTDFRPPDERIDRFGRLIGKRDLSGNAKLNLYAHHQRFWLSIGATDFAGLAQNFSAAYGVASVRWGGATVSAGFAGGDNPSFDGPFVNARYRINRVLTIAAEIDTDSAAQAGLALTLPLRGNLAIDGTFSGGDGETRAGIGLTYRLGGHADGRLTSKADDSVLPERVTTSEPDGPSGFATALQADGFQHVRVGRGDDGDYRLDVENRLYTHSARDALAAIASIGQEHVPSANSLEVTLLERGVPSVRLNVSSRAGTGLTIKPQQSVAPPRATTWTSPTEGRRKSLADFSIEPALVSAVGTEFGLIDYSLALRPGVSVPLWPGAQASVNAHVPIARSTNFEDGAPFGRNAFETSLERAVLMQYLSPVGGVHSQLELGQIRLFGSDYNVFKGQAAWQSARYPLQLHVRAARFGLIDSGVRRDVLLGTASYLFSRWHTKVAATYGQFFFGEHGARFTAERWFGDRSVGFFIRAVAHDDLVGGLRFSTPIGPRKGYSWKRLTLTGAARWSHALQTTINFPDSSDNRLQPAFLFEPMADSDIPVRVLDSGRLGIPVSSYP